MEWKHDMTLDDLRTLSDLETFLGGMETAGRETARRDHPTLKPSLVEWKQPGAKLPNGTIPP